MQPLAPTQDYQWFLIRIDTVLHYGVALLVQSDDSSHIIMVLEKNLNILDHLKFDNGLLFFYNKYSKIKQ